MIDYYRFSKRESPFWAMFCLFPFFSIIIWFIKGNEVNYDYFWIPFCVFLILNSIVHNRILYQKYIKLSFVMGGLFLLKYLIPWLFEDISINASIMDGKWFLYLFAALLWIDIYGTPRIEKVYKYCVFFCIIYICKALYMLFTNSLSRGGVLMEANYDGYMILIVYCFSDVVRKKRWWNWVITLATLLTFSRTGWCAFFAINMYKLYKKNMLYAVCFIPIILLLVYYGEMIRGESARNMDRFVYWTQAYIYFHNTNFTNILLGTMPGVQLKMEILPEFMWTVELFENMRNLKGVYPFMFHSTYLRLAFTWGIPLATLYLLFLVKKILYGKYSPLKNLCIITIIQSFSLSALTLQNVSFLLFVCFLLALQNDKNIRKYRFMKKNVNTYQ